MRKYPDDFIGKVIEGDCLSVMREMPDKCVDLIATDPEYGIGYKTSIKKAWGGRKRKADAKFGDDTGASLEVWAEAYRILKPTGAIYSFMSWDGLGFLASQLIMAGFQVPIRIVWDKVNWGSGDLRYFGQQTEDILFASCGEHELRTEKREGNLWQVWRAEMWNQGGHSGHPTEKPRSIMEKIIRYSSDPDSIVLDMYSGSGTTCVAAERLGRRWVGVELSPKYCTMARKRIAAEQAQGKLF